MLVELDATLFQNVDEFQRTVFIGFLAKSRHKVLLTSESDPVYQAWRSQAEKRLLAAFDQMLLAGIAWLNSPGATGAGRILVSEAGADNWALPVPALRMATAYKILTLPVYVFLENNRSDKHFLLRFMTKTERDQLLAAHKNGAVYFVHGGGLGDLHRQIVEVATDVPVELRRHLCIAVFDSDALKQGVPSRKSTSVHTTCTQLEVHCHRLLRRNIENYVTRGALSLWCAGSRRGRKLYQAVVALFGLPTYQRHYFNVKSGLNGDEDAVTKELFSSLPDYAKHQLKNGFGSEVSSCYERDDWITRQDLEQDGSWFELRPTVEKLLRMG